MRQRSAAASTRAQSSSVANRRTTASMSAYQSAREVGAERQMKNQVQQEIFGHRHEARAFGSHQRTCPPPEPIVVDLDDALEAQVPGRVPVQIDPRAIAHELGKAP